MKTIVFLAFVALSHLAFPQDEQAEKVLRYEDLPKLENNKGEFTSYISEDGTEWKVGEKIKIGIPKKAMYRFVYQSTIPIQEYPISESIAGEIVTIKKITTRGLKHSGLSAFFKTTGQYKLINYVIDFESAYKEGEVRKIGKTSDEALAELKKAKDKLDLGLITQEEYDKLKKELSKLIK